MKKFGSANHFKDDEPLLSVTDFRKPHLDAWNNYYSLSNRFKRKFERLMDKFRTKCKSCPVGKLDEYDCGYPDCSPYIWQVWINKTCEYFIFNQICFRHSTKFSKFIGTIKVPCWLFRLIDKIRKATK